MKIVQIFAREEEKFNEFNKSNKKLMKANIKQLVVFSIYRPLMFVAYVIGLSIVLGYGGVKVIEGSMTLG